MNNTRLIIADADAIVALSSKVDTNHERAKHILEDLATLHASVLFPITAVCEATTAIQKKLNNPEAASYVINQIEADNFPVQTIELKTLMTAFSLFKPQGSKRNTLFDAVIAALAKQLDAEAIFSFDGWYRKIGLTLVSDFIEQEKAA
jgi:predicted nucleic acid-binding protein